MSLQNFFLVKALRLIRQVMPPFVTAAIIKLIPTSFLLSISELVGLAVIIPLTQIILKPQIIHSNPRLEQLFLWVHAPSEMVFVVYLFILIVFFFILKNVIIYWASLKQTKLTYTVADQLTVLQFHNYLYQAYDSHVKSNTSILLRSIIELPYNFTSGIMLPVVQLINEITVMFLIILSILLFSPVLFLSVILFISPFFVLYGKLYQKELKTVSMERDKGHSEMFRKGKLSIEGFREILLFDKFKFFEPQFSASVKRFSWAVGRLYHLNIFSPKIIETLAVLSVLGIFTTGLILEYDIEKLVTFLVTFAIAAYRLIPSVNKIILSYNNIKSSEYVFDYYRSTQLIYKNKNMINEESAPITFTRNIQLKNISFSFGDKVLFNNINLAIGKGEIIGIVGKSGSGKSTLINILLGLYPPSVGNVEVDGIKIDKSNIRNWHRTIGFVPQNPVLLEGTIEENIAFGVRKDLIDKKMLEWSISNSRLKEFIDGLTLGLNTPIGDKNLNISGGQRQRIAIARALYHGGQILIFDEVTSSLDRETEYFLTDVFKALSEKSYTIAIIAHRTETLRHCDHIYRLAEGRLSDSLTFSEIHPFSTPHQ